MSIAIQTHQLSVSIGNKQLLKPTSVALQSGQLTVLLGPNGAGKSTLLKAMIGELRANGKVEVFGQARSNWRSERLARLLAVLPQSSELTFPFSVREVVELGALPLSVSKLQLDDIVDKNLALTDVSHLQHRPYPMLSGGEKQRVHFARVLTQLAQAGEQAILLLDEPTSALDLAHQHNTLKLAKQQAEQGACVVAVIHDLNLAAQYADRILLLEQGSLVADGSPWEVLSERRIEAVYGYPITVMPHPRADYPLLVSA